MTFKIEGWLAGERIAEECGVEESAVSEMVRTLQEEGFTVVVQPE